MKKFIKIISSVIVCCLILASVACGGSDSVRNVVADGKDAIRAFTTEPDYAERNGVKREWNKVSSYFINYGTFQEEMLKYDVGIIQDSNITDEDIQKFKDAGVWTIAYITLGEDYNLKIGDGLGPGGYASYYLYDESEQPIANGDWGSYYVDPSNPTWRTITYNEIQRIIDRGIDGIFMDTVDSVDAFPETANAMYNFIKSIREKFPTIKMVLNRGFTAIPSVYEYIDGNMFELFSTALNLSTFEYEVLDANSVTFMYNRQNAVQIINAVRQKKYFPVFAMDYCSDATSFEYNKQIIYDTDWEYDFIPYINQSGREIGGAMCPYDLKPTSVRGKKALLLKDGENIPQNADCSVENYAYTGNGTKITVDSCFNGYSRSPLNDGYISTQENFEKIGWMFANWASSETASDHYVEIEFSAPRDVNGIAIWWAYDNGSYYSSQKVKIQKWNGSAWEDVSEVSGIENESEKTEVLGLGLQGVTKIRILQPSGFGSKYRRQLMWITEIQAYA